MAMSADPLVYVVVLNCNGQSVIADCLRTLLASEYAHLRVCVVDNASTDGSPEWIEREVPKVEVLRNRENLGWSGANNVGIRHALARGAGYVWILNNDVEVEPDCVSRLIAFAVQHERVGVLGPIIHYFDPRERLWFPGGRVDLKTFFSDHTSGVEEFRALPHSARYISGCALLVRRDVFDRIGIIDERFFIYFEDVDFCLRAARAGFEMDVVESARMYHKVSAYSGGTESASPWKAYYTLRSGLLFWRKQLGWLRFHGDYCHTQLGKWVLSPLFEKMENGQRVWADAVMDAFWYFLAGKRTPRNWPRAPSWFKKIMIRRPWLVPECMALQFGHLAALAFKRKPSGPVQLRPAEQRSWLQKTPGWIRRRLEGLGFLLLLPTLLLGLGAALAGRAMTAGSGGAGEPGLAVRRLLKRWCAFMAHGLGALRERWWTELSLEPGWVTWRYLLLAELFDLMNLARPRSESAARDPSADSKNILVVNLGHLGDILHTVPLLRQLRRQYPAARIQFMVGPWSQALADRIPYKDVLITYAPHVTVFNRGQKKESPGIWPEFRFLRDLRREAFDVMFSCSSGQFLDLLLNQAVRPVRWVGADCWPGELYFHHSAYSGREYDSRLYEATRLKNLGAPWPDGDGEQGLEYWVEEGERQRARRLLNRSDGTQDQPRIILAPGAGWPGKLWEVNRFAAVGDYLAQRYAAKLFIVGGAAEKTLAQELLSGMTAKPGDLTGQTTLNELAAVIEQADLLIGSDSGPLHLAVALGVPTVGLFGPGFPAKWAARGARHVMLWHDVSCRCVSWHIRTQCTRDHACMRSITVDEVKAAADKLLAAAQARTTAYELR